MMKRRRPSRTLTELWDEYYDRTKVIESRTTIAKVFWTFGIGITLGQQSPIVPTSAGRTSATRMALWLASFAFFIYETWDVLQVPNPQLLLLYVFFTVCLIRLPELCLERSSEELRENSTLTPAKRRHFLPVFWILFGLAWFTIDALLPFFLAGQWDLKLPSNYQERAAFLIQAIRLIIIFGRILLAIVTGIEAVDRKRKIELIERTLKDAMKTEINPKTGALYTQSVYQLLNEIRALIWRRIILPTVLLTVTVVVVGNLATRLLP
jgi:hypothetical protein